MARIEWVKHRLENWALWKDKESRGGLGYATSSSFTWEVVDTSGYRELAATVNDVEAQETDAAVTALKLGKGHLFMTLQHMYVRNRGVEETARIMGRAVSTVHANLGEADAALALWFRVKAQAKEDARRDAEHARRQHSGGFRG